MAPTLRLHASLQTEATMSPSVWGFEALDLHDAYWRASGIQCVRREEPFVSQRGHDLFMLLEPRQCVLFDLVPLANQIAWNRASAIAHSRRKCWIAVHRAHRRNTRKRTAAHFARVRCSITELLPRPLDSPRKPCAGLG